MRMFELFTDMLSPVPRTTGSEMSLPPGRRTELAVVVAIYLLCCIWAVLRSDFIFELNQQGNLVDPMLSSGFAVTLVALGLSLWIERRYLAMMNYLECGHLIADASGSIRSVHNEILLFRSSLRIVLPVIVAAVILSGFVYAFMTSPVNGQSPFALQIYWEFLIGAVLLGLLCAHRLGSSASFGGFAQFLSAPSIRWRLVPGHPDGVGGVGSFGRYLAYQGFLSAIPLVWLTFWIIAGPLWPEADYLKWTAMQVVLWLVAAFVAYRGFYAPTLLLSRRFRVAKNELNTRFSKGLEAELVAAHALLDSGASHLEGLEASERITRR